MSKYRLADAYVQARNYTPTQGRAIRLIVIHAMESPEDVRTAENVAAWFAGRSGTAPLASAHFNADVDSIVQSVDLRDVAWAAPGANHDGVQIELAGRAGQTPAQWDDAYSRGLLDRAARLCAGLARDYDIPLRFLSVSEVLAGHRGFATHDTISKAYRRSNHWDPGPNFPATAFLGRVRSLGGGMPPAPVVKAKAPWTFTRRGRGVFARGSLNHANVIQRITRTMNEAGHTAPWVATVDGREIGRGRLWPMTSFKRKVAQALQAGKRVNLNGSNVYRPDGGNTVWGPRMALVSIAKDDG